MAVAGAYHCVRKKGYGSRTGFGFFPNGAFYGDGVAGVGAGSCLWAVDEGRFERFEGLFHPRAAGQVIMTTIGGKVHALRVV